ncbi:TetR/AcrR family transcriptional regulator [Kitasatospora mediocidica]|uniref:TetR/AcrR family transcriptional regulator n=1 Tax=Kitasatospora mediocidica TaxID=58352 RepID=UPI000691DAE7|nr:TetR/AcrR family transcriptional regulator [Kitasatospora mediocidica]
MAVRDADARPMRRDAARNHQLVLDAAREVVSEFGTDASVELIASRAGVGVGTVYRRFPNKEALLDELVRLILDELVEAGRRVLARGDGSGLEAFLRVLGRSFMDHHRYADQLIGRTTAESAAQLWDVVSELLEQAREFDLVGADVELGDVMTSAWALRGIVQTTGAIAPHAWERHLDILLAGLRAPAVRSTHPALTRADLTRITGAGRPDGA